MLNLIRRANSFPGRKAIISNGNTYNYQDLLLVSRKVASGLLDGAADLEESRVAFMVDPSFEYVAMQWGIWRAGGIAVPLCVMHPLPSLEYVIKNSRAEILVVSDKYYDIFVPLAREWEVRLLRAEDLVTAAIGQLPVVRSNRRAMILYTSGTTSLPKGVVTTFDNIEFQIGTLVEAWEWTAEDHILNILPLHHVHGIINVLSCALWSGACCEFLPKFDAGAVWERFRTGGLNLFMAVPTIYYKLISYWDGLPEPQRRELSDSCRSFRLMVSGSAALPVPVLERWQAITGQLLLERYGMTEIGMALSNSYRGERRPGHVGLPLPGVDLRLMGEEGTLVEPGQEGEIQIKGPNVFLEYWDNETATRDAFTDDGWFRTGDISVFNDGSYRILGRNSVDIIKSGGYKISALEIEEVLLRYPDILECGVVGLADEEWGELVAAGLVIGSADLDREALKTWLKEQLPGYKVPRRFLILDALPRNTLGKLTKNELKQLFQHGND